MSDVSGAPATPADAPVEGTAAPVAPVDGTAAPVAPVDGTAAPVAPVDGTAEPIGAPETYETFTLPEGMEMNEAQLATFLPIAKDLNLTQEQAQKLVALDAEQKRAGQQAQEQASSDMIEGWREETRTDPELGGANLQQTLAHTSVFLNKFATPALRQLLDDSGIGNNKEAIRLFAAAGKAMGEDGVIPGGSVNSAKKTQAQLLYPNQEV